MTLEDEFECREKILMRVFFGRSGLSELWFNEESQRLFTSILLDETYVLHWGQDEGFWTCSGCGKQVRKLSDANEKVAFLGVFGLSKHWCKTTQFNKSPFINFSFYRIFLTLTLIEEIKRLVLMIFQFNYRENPKPN